MFRSLSFLVFVALCWATVARADNTQDISNPDMTKAVWMWSHPDAMQVGGDYSFYRFKFRAEQPIKEATILLTADNGYQLYINNKMIAEEASADAAEWSSIERYRIEDILVSRAVNCIAIRAESLGGNACGLIVAIKIVFEDGEILEKYSGDSWLCTEEPRENWWEPDHNDSQWINSFVLTPLGGGPWGNSMVISQTVTDPSTLRVLRPAHNLNWMRRPDNFSPPDPDFEWPAGIVYLQGRAPDNSTPLATTNFRIGETRIAWENDVPAPSLSGNKMFTLVPASPDATPQLILDAGGGWIGFPVSSFDGQTIYFSMVPEGQTFYHLYSINADGSHLKQLTSGQWHDYDPCPLPDDTIIFSSTRTAARDEYHANPSRSLFCLDLSNGSIKPVTYHITADTDTRLMADGRLAFVRYDNFSERAKVESHIHCVRPDGTAGEILLGPDRGAIRYDLKTAAEHDAAWLRNYGFGAPSPLPNGRIAALSHAGPVITKLQNAGDSDQADTQHDLSVPELKSAVAKPVPITIEPMPCDVSLIDIAPMPDNRLLAATLRKVLAVVDPETGSSYKILQSTEPIHSVNFLGERPMPRIWPNFIDPSVFPTSHDSAGTLFCDNVFNTKQTEGEWARVRAVRIFMGRPLTLRSARHQYGHIGTIGIDLGTFPIMPNGSFTAKVPADMPLAIQAVDAEGRSVVNELSWIYTRPGEFRACIGCHADRNAAPETTARMSGQRSIVDLTVGINSPEFRANNGANGGVHNLQLERMRDTIGVNLHPEYEILAEILKTEPKSEGRRLRPVVQHLVNELQTAEESGKRYAAIQRMGILRPSGVAPALCEAMRKDSSGEVRMIAALTLACCATPESVPMLLEALSDPHEHVGHAAQITLEHITGHVETESHSPVKDVPTRERKDYWTQWLQKNSPEKIEAMNAKFLVGPFDWTRSADSVRFRQAVDALAHYGKSETVKASLRKILTEQDEIDTLSKIAVIRTLGILRDEQSIPILSDILVDCCEKKTPPAGGWHEFGWTAMPDHIGGAAAESLGRIGTQAAVDGLARGFQTLEEFWFYTRRTADHEWLMGSISAIIHYRILEALEAIMTTTNIDVQKSIDELANSIIRSIPIDSDRGIWLDNDDYERLVGRVLARSSLYDMYLDACLNVLEGKPCDTDIMEAVSDSPPAVSTGILEPTSRAAMVIAVLVHDKTSEANRKRIRETFANFQKREASRERSWTCFMLARALGRLKDKESIPLFLSCLTDEKREFDFGSAPPPNIFLHEAMTPIHRASVAAALGMMGDPVALPVLLAVTEDFHNAMDVRDAAAFAIQDIGRQITPERKAKVPDGFVERLKTLAQTYPEMYPGKTLSKAYEIWANVK